MWHAVEDRILQAWTEHILATQTKPSHLSLHFDGVRVSRNVMEEAQRYIESCQKAIKEKTSFDVVIVEKKAKDFMSHVREQSTQKVEIRHLPDACTLVGNCIPCALWHIAPLLRLTITSSIQNHELSENTEALKRRWRTYRSAAALYKTDLMCSVGLPADDVLSYILHYEGNGCPHCVAVQVLADRQNVMVLNGRTSMKLSMLAFREAFAAAVDRSTVVTYWQRRSRGELADKTGHLLDMQAGADISSDDEAANDEVCTARFSFDEDNKPVVSDNIQQTLRREVEETLLDLRARTQRVNGRSQCPLCPFRSFSELRQLRTHVTKHHSAKNQYVCSGTKQIKIILAMYDHAASSQRTSRNLLCESAALLRETVKPPLASTCNHIDKSLRLVFDAAGPSYVNEECIGQTLSVRRVRNLYYTQSFADLLIREMILSHAQVSVPQWLFMSH